MDTPILPPQAPAPPLPQAPPMHEIWTALRGRWLRQKPTGPDPWASTSRNSEGQRTSTTLAEFLRARLGEPVTKQSVSQWSTGSDGRSPPWRAVYSLLRELGLALVIEPDGSCRLVPATRRAR